MYKLPCWGITQNQHIPGTSQRSRFRQKWLIKQLKLTSTKAVKFLQKINILSMTMQEKISNRQSNPIGKLNLVDPGR